MGSDYFEFKHTPFALLLWYKGEGGAEEAKVYRGLATWDEEKQVIGVHHPESGQYLLSLAGVQLDRVKKIEPEVADMFLGCAYGISLSVSDIKQEDVGLLQTGLKF